MASGSTILTIQSRDYGGGQGGQTANITVNWATDAAGNLSLSYGGSSNNSWWVSNSNTEMYVFIDGTSVMSTNVSPVGSGGQSPVTGPTVANLVATLIGQLGTAYIPNGGQLIIACGVTSPPSPTASYPNAFPSWAQTQGDQTPAVIPPADWRPGERYISSVWQSLNRSGGVCQRLAGSTWTEMKTKAGTGDPPERYIDGAWKNMDKIGANAG